MTDYKAINAAITAKATQKFQRQQRRLANQAAKAIASKQIDSQTTLHLVGWR